MVPGHAGDPHAHDAARPTRPSVLMVTGAYAPELSAWVKEYTVSFLSVSVNPPDTGVRVANRPGGGEYVDLPGLSPRTSTSTALTW